MVYCVVSFDDTMLDFVWKNLAEENKRYSDLDSKATGLMTITGVLITLL